MEMIKSGSKHVLENVLGMKCEDGDSSYAKSSSMQLNTLQAVKLMLERAILENIRYSNMGGIFRIADFGCGTGKNTLLVADSVVSPVQRSLHEEHEMQEFEVPDSVEQRRSPRAYISSDCGEGVAAAYLQQFHVDLTAFLRARAEEMVDGGCMFIFMYGRNAGIKIEEVQRLLGYAARELEYAFEELVNEGIMEREKWEAFKIPYFGANVEEVESIVQKDGLFILEFVKIVTEIHPFPLAHVQGGEENMFMTLVANNYKAVFESIVEVHLGCERLTQEFFLRISKRASISVEDFRSKKIELVVAFLTKK